MNDGGDLDFEAHPQFKLGVTVSDGALSATATVTVNLQNLAEVAPKPGVTVTPQQVPSITTENNSIVTGNPGGAATFSVVLNTQPSADVVIAFASSDQTEGKPDNSVLTFTHDNWSTPQTLIVRGVDDLAFDNDISYSVSGTVKSDDIDYIRGIVIGNLTLTNRDDSEDQPVVLLGDQALGHPRDTLYGGNGADKLYGNEDIDFLYGGLGNDSVDGGNDDDKLYGEDGNDILKGQEGSDFLDGGAGNDELYGGLDGDILNGGLGNDQLYGEQGADTLNGGDGNDSLDGGMGADQMSGGKGADTYYVDDKGDKVDDQGADGAVDTVLIPVFLSYTLNGSIENGKLTGAENSNLTGNGSANVLVGNSGNNILDGGTGNDALKGGLGTDTADYSAATTGVIASLITNKASGGGQGADTLILLCQIHSNALADRRA